MPLSEEESKNLSVYSRDDVVEGYASASYITSAELRLFYQYLIPDMRILDIGVGGGRTSPILASDAAEYIGVDYSSEMIRACKNRFPQWDYRVMDASDLSAFEDSYFDMVVFSFNGMGYLYPEEKILKCLSECSRVLKQGGKLIFSLHHARSLFHRPPPLSETDGARPLLGSFRKSYIRFFQRIGERAFWKKRGYIDSDSHGGLKTYLATPEVVTEHLDKSGFRLIDVVGDDYPRPNISWCTRWYYYAAIKPNEGDKM